MKKLVLIYNPTAGTGKVRTHLGEIVEEFANRDFEVTLHPTTGPGDATRFAQSRGAEFDHIVCAGGDGTLNEVVTGLMQVPNPPPLGYIPAGTTNDFSHTLELPANLTEAAELAVSGLPQAVDVGRFNGRPFIYIAAFGLFSDVSYTTPQKMKHSLGHLAYVLSGIPQLAAITSYHMKIQVDDTLLEEELIYGMVSDTVTVGGLLDLNREDVRINDGRFEVFLVRIPRSLAELNELIHALLHQQPCSNILAFQAGQVRFLCDTPVPWTLDGEYGGTLQQAEVQVLHRAVRLVTRPGVKALS